MIGKLYHLAAGLMGRLPGDHSYLQSGAHLLSAIRGVRANHPGLSRSAKGGPVMVQVQTSDACNGRCGICPYGSSNRGQGHQLMDEGLYRHILDQLAASGTVWRFTPMLQSEPLTDPKIVDRMRLARQALGPGVRLVMVTNGTLLTPSLARRLERAGCDAFLISLDALTPETYGRVRPGLSFEAVHRNVSWLLKHPSRADITLRFLRQQENQGQDKAFYRYWRGKGASVQFQEPCNRAGTLEAFTNLRRNERASLVRVWRLFCRRCLVKCSLPFTTLNVLVDGRVVACCHDWEPSLVLGDLSQQSLKEVWHGERARRLRRRLLARRAQDRPPCQGCSLLMHP